MRKLKQIVITLTLFYAGLCSGQTHALTKNTLPDLPTEQVYLHLNTNNIFSGENLFYKTYVTTESNLLSNYSSIVYVRLISPNKKTILEQKIKLSKGLGYGDFLIPTDIPTGSYKLIAYTKLGLLQSSDNIFSVDLGILNPYIQLNSDFVSVENNVPDSQIIDEFKNIESEIKISLSDTVFNKRHKVELGIFVEESSNFGDYSISVKKIDTFLFYETSNIQKHKQYLKTVKVKNGLDFLPDLRGDLITGTINSRKDKAPVENQSLALLIPDKNFILKLGKTDDKGRFFFNVEDSYSSKNALIQVLNEPNGDYNLEFDEEPEPDLSSLTFNKLKLNENSKEQILKRSIKNQIESSYSSVKMNQLDPHRQEPFFGSKGVKYNLDDYTRFPDLNQTLIEIIKGVSFEKNKDSYDIKIRATDYKFQSPLSALVLLDGLLIKDHSFLYDFDAKNIKSITVIKDKYYYGGNVFQGVLSIETFEKNYQNLTPLLDVKTFDLLSPEPEKIYHKVSYDDDENLDHIPDFRTQLFWKPDLKLNLPKTLLEFYTSDESGTYEIVVEGISKSGEKLRATMTFKVK